MSVGAQINVGILWSEIRGGDYVPWKKIDKACSYFVPGSIFSPSYKQGHWDGVVHLYKKGTFPSGLLSVVREVLNKENIPYTMTAKFSWPERQYDWKLKPEVQVRDRHLEAINAITTFKRGMLQLPTRFGKTTVVASGSIAALGVPTLFIVHQLDPVYDAKRVFESFIDGVGEVGLIGDSQCTYRPVTVACIDSLHNKLTDYTMQKYLHEKVKYVIVDETQYFGPGEYKEVLYQCEAPYRVFMSATVERNDGADLELQAASGRLIYSLSERDMIAENYISDVDIEMVPYDHRLYNKKATGIVYSDFYDAYIVNNIVRNQVIVNETLRLLSEGHPTIIIVKRIAHGHMLKEMLIQEGITNVDFVWGDTDAKQRIAIRNDFNNGRYDVLIGSTVFDTAIDLRRASGLVLAAGGNSKIRAPQRVGRILSTAMGKIAYARDIKDLNIKYFEDDAKDRQNVYVSRFGDERVHVRHTREMSEVERMFGIDTRSMFDNLL